MSYDWKVVHLFGREVHGLAGKTCTYFLCLCKKQWYLQTSRNMYLLREDLTSFCITLQSPNLLLQILDTAWYQKEHHATTDKSRPQILCAFLTCNAPWAWDRLSLRNCWFAYQRKLLLLCPHFKGMLLLSCCVYADLNLNILPLILLSSLFVTTTTGPKNTTCTWLWECYRQVEVEVVSNRSIQLHQTTYK